MYLYNDRLIRIQNDTLYKAVPSYVFKSYGTLVSACINIIYNWAFDGDTAKEIFVIPLYGCCHDVLLYPICI